MPLGFSKWSLKGVEIKDSEVMREEMTSGDAVVGCTRLAPFALGNECARLKYLGCPSAAEAEPMAQGMLVGVECRVRRRTAMSRECNGVDSCYGGGVVSFHSRGTGLDGFVRCPDLGTATPRRLFASGMRRS